MDIYMRLCSVKGAGMQTEQEYTAAVKEIDDQISSLKARKKDLGKLRKRELALAEQADALKAELETWQKNGK